MLQFFRFSSVIFVFVCIACTSSKKDKSSTNSKIISQKRIEEKFTIPVEYFPEKDTKNVNHKLDSLLKRINKRHDFHGAILVSKNKKIVYKNQIGFADFKKKIPLNEESTFQLASVSKQFTAAAIMLLHERNKIKITDTVNTYFPNFPFENITIKHLLNHTAGLPKYFWVAEHEWQKEKAPTNLEMMELFSCSSVQRFFKPGRNFDYSNTGYFILASIVEKVSGTSFGNFLKENIFDPLDMKNSYVYSCKHDIPHKNQLTGYRLYRGWRHIGIKNTVNDGVVGDKNVYSTTEDLFKWTYGLNSGKLLSKASLDLMYTKGETIYGRKIPYGFGFRVDRSDEKNIYHYGKWNGFSTALTNYLDDDLVVIVLEHTSYNALKSLNKKIKKIVTKNLDV
ncbi:class A beta-lactamase-related serine hydrolase [Polaribacter sp. WD7]|uniref:serine hydrolase domain-containing protein n=1 Tax=Polaribacter sp. WD7 TaxID=2269061 RepID=UPI000DF25B96|nr:serine hydrolase domain-containing protein [Polaribacter sp. WD7]RCS26751.1 class A beta-lactamase-related serine hydrolase [Polaribacter sp. WD7]